MKPIVDTTAQNQRLLAGFLKYAVHMYINIYQERHTL